MNAVAIALSNGQVPFDVLALGGTAIRSAAGLRARLAGAHGHDACFTSAQQHRRLRPA
jgi:hypothetical protein